MALKMIIILLAIANLVSGKAVRKEREAVTDYDSIKTTFRLFTRNNVNNDRYQILSANDSSSLSKSFFNSSTPKEMVVHGFLENGLMKWLKNMKDELLKAGDFNVILIDWGKGSGLPYTQATANTRVVGAEITKLINALKEQVGSNPEDFHIIGQSLGAHIGGYAGTRLPNLGRITDL
ncbi:hypothetical protein CHS0354_011084 [Potamilus streckersoni]|uniref:Lipase domain-containing protein n=1 Tax=Potamilus streckersoni TaxID=2493646 RepID=A0AAE0TMI5_9BIVA|nr:hypothetical protein CHS0354_011084 [Potamilus streckersoni]